MAAKAERQTLVERQRVGQSGHWALVPESAVVWSARAGIGALGEGALWVGKLLLAPLKGLTGPAQRKPSHFAQAVTMDAGIGSIGAMSLSSLTATQGPVYVMPGSLPICHT